MHRQDRTAQILADRHWGATFRFPYGAVLTVHQTIADREIAPEDRIPSSLVGVRRLHYSRHPSVAVCAFIRSQLAQ